MPIISSDIKFFLSGGSTNTWPSLSLGGEISNQEIGTSIYNLFDIVSSTELLVGDNEYRCFYVKNNSETSAFFNIIVWVSSSSLSSSVSIELALASQGVNGTAELLESESSAPSAETFSVANSFLNALTINQLEAGDFHAVWVKRVVTGGIGASGVDSILISVEGQTE